MKDLIKESKGLTLLELLAVVVILSIISVIVIPAIAAIIDNTRKDAQLSNAVQVIAATKTYVAAEHIDISDNSTVTILLKTLIEEGYSSSIIDPQTKEYYDAESTNVKIKRVGNNYEYTVTLTAAGNSFTYTNPKK